jgi:hypothetical protein
MSHQLNFSESTATYQLDYVEVIWFHTKLDDFFGKVGVCWGKGGLAWGEIEWSRHLHLLL